MVFSRQFNKIQKKCIQFGETEKQDYQSITDGTSSLHTSFAWSLRVLSTFPRVVHHGGNCSNEIKKGVFNTTELMWNSIALGMNILVPGRPSLSHFAFINLLRLQKHCILPNSWDTDLVMPEYYPKQAWLMKYISKPAPSFPLPSEAHTQLHTGTYTHYS